MDPVKLIKLLSRASGVELHPEDGGSRDAVTIKFDDRDDAYLLFEAVSDLECEEEDEDA
jgi:hypothetical protein